MESQQVLFDVTLSLNSVKKKERWEAFEHLTDLLSQGDVIKNLHHHSVSPERKISWDVVFIRVHNAALSLIDEHCSKSRQISDKNVQILQNVILLVVQRSLDQKVILISSNLLTSSLLAVFETEIRRKVLGFTYLSIFCKYVMTERRNWGQLKKDCWVGLKNLCKSHIKKPLPGTQSIVFLEILCDVIKNSTKNCQTSTSFSDLFEFVKDVYSTYKVLGTNYEICLLRLTNILCLQLAIEFRYKVCEFTEDVFDCVVGFLKKNNADLNILVKDFLMTSISVHNPNGVCESDKSFYASNSVKWKSQIQKIYVLCLNRTKDILRNTNTMEVELDLLELFVDASHLVFVYHIDNSSDLCDLDETGPVKKRKYSLDSTTISLSGSINTGKLLRLDSDYGNLVTNLQASDGWFWLQFLELLICKYPKDLKYKYNAIIEVLCQLFCDKKDILITKISLRCLKHILDAEDSLELTNTDTKILNESWNKICSELIRCLHKETCSEISILLQALICHAKLQDPAPLIKLFCSGVLSASVENFRTLSAVCQNCVLPDVIFSDGSSIHIQPCFENIREHLLSWLIKGEGRYPCKDYAKLLVALISKKFDEENVKKVDKDNILITHTNINDFCKLITSNYRTTAFENVKFLESHKHVENSGPLRVDNGVKTVLIDLLKDRWKYLFKAITIEEHNFGNQLKTLENCYWFCELICHLLSNAEMVNASSVENHSLVENLEILLYACTTKTLELLKMQFFDLSHLFNIYSANFHPNVKKIIRQSNFTNLNLLQFLFEVFQKFREGSLNEVNVNQNFQMKSNSEFSNLIKSTKSVFHFQTLTESEKVIVSSVEILCQYITVPNLQNSNQASLCSNIIDSLLEDDGSKTCSNLQLQLVLRVVYAFTRYTTISVSVLNRCLDLMTTILNKNPQEPELNITMLQVLKDMLHLVCSIGNLETRQKYMKLIDEFKLLIMIKKCCGVKTASKFIECLVDLYKCDTEGTWTVLVKNGESYKACEDVLSFFNHPSHEVRMTVALHVGELFVANKSSAERTLIWQRKMIENLFDELENCENLYPKDRGCVFEYVVYVTSSTSLLSWANIICKSTYWRKKALFYLLLMAFLKQYKRSEVNDIMKLIFEQLKIESPKDYFKCNFIYFLSKWVDKGRHVQDFPYYILGCKTLDEFIKTNFKPIIMVYSQLGQLDIINVASTKLKRTVVHVLKECHPELMSFILPSVRKFADSKYCAKMCKLKEFVEEKLSPELSVQLTLKNLDLVIFHLIKNMHDPSYLRHLCCFSGNVEDDESPFGFTGAQIIETLKSLGKRVLESMLLNSPSKVEKILTLLMGNMERFVAYEDKIFAFYKYIFCVDLIGQVTKRERVFEVINNYIIRDVVYFLLAVIRRDQGQELTSMACECFRKLAEYYLPEFCEIFGEFLPAITTALTSAILYSNTKALDVLRFLVCDNYSKLERNIAQLDPFPSDIAFSEVSQHLAEKQTKVLSNLRDIVQHFVNSGGNKNSGCRIEGLKHLRKSLSEKKDELKQMFEHLTGLRGFSEDCKKSLLHQLICTLVELTTNKNSEVRMEAAKCLGELGASDLTTLLLRPENNFVSSEASDSAINKFFKISMISLSDLLISDNFFIKEAAAKALYATLSVQQGKHILRTHFETCKNFEYILPFETDSTEVLHLKIRKEIFVSNMNNSALWSPKEHEIWITNLVDSLLQSLSDSSGIINSYREVIHLKWKFAEDLLPYMLDLILFSGDEDCTKIINNNFNSFFEKNFNFRNKTLPYVSKQSVRCMLNVVDYIRIQRHEEGYFQQPTINVNYLHFAKAAFYCSAYFTSIFYTELWSEKKKRENDSLIDVNTLCELFPVEGSALTEILRECHSKIGNLDGINGCGYTHILETPSEIQHYEHVNNWNMSLLHHDIQLSMGNEKYEKDLISSLESSGMYYILNSMRKINSCTTNLTPLQYKCAAQLSDWSLLNTSPNTNATDTLIDSFEKSYYFALKAFRADDDVTFNNEIQRARKTVLNKLFNCSLESTKNLYLPISELQSIKELEEFVGTVRGLNKSELGKLISKWQKQDSIRYSDFKLTESILANRAVFIKIALGKTEKSSIDSDLRLVLCQTYCSIIETARKEKKYETAIRMLNYLNGLDQVPKEIFEKLKIEKARILWESGDNQIGRFLLSHYIKKNEITGELKAKGLRIYGDWMAKTKSENSREIIQNYYLKSIVQSNDTAHLLDCYASLAKFAYSNYEQLNDLLSSPLFEIKQNLISTQQDLALELRQELGWNQNREKRMAYQIVARQSAIDENEIKNNKAERDSYLSLALKYYLLSLKEGEKYNLFVFRITSIWLSNSSNPDVVQQLKKMLPQISTYKFLCLLPQLMPRMADVCLISDLVERILQDHPHHTLPLLFALSNSYEDLKFSGTKTNITTPRVQAARSILDKFQKEKKLERPILEMNVFTKALIEVANYYPAEKEGRGIPIDFPAELKIRQIRDLSTVSVPSLNIPYDKKCSYDRIVGVHRFEENYYLVGGINLPKRIKCIGSDGIGRSLLVKGKDDLRQDAVMQQVFTIMNSLLSENAETKKRKLIIKTYRVVPLSQRSGIIEWCENTQPLSLYLTGPDGKSGAHKKFYPDDMAPFECRCMVRNVFAQPGVTNQDKLNVFVDICKRFHPVFHYFFIEKFPAAGVWFERRLAYIHSVATSSMIGYILGIGDRHVHNILIDNSTAEVIHIDLGIAFEQGKTLPIPETVPFRLTRDIVDGMGLYGIEGDFRISCIKTMEVLREHRDTILTILEVLLYDPLYTWTITPEKAYSMQGQTETDSSTTEKSSPDMETNKMAERALIRLKQKLQGTETGCVATNVEGQISYLVQQARDPNNLCRLFHGWQAYL